MTLEIERDDGTPLDAADLRATLTAESETDRNIVFICFKTDDRKAQGRDFEAAFEAELLVGFRADRGVCMWQAYGDDDAVTTGGTNEEAIIYGTHQIPFPPGSEIDAAAVIDAAEEFASTGARPTCVTWTSYQESIPFEDTGMSGEALDALFGRSGNAGSASPDTGC
ncbi:Imm1 family immunity protein [Saccharopolyspora shandongensis]|uniref:Imm1 family immunity protein n=1 Tax=Saccharopolyspora shandongensis TaxID=418495 RepID=UPI0033F111AB